METRGHRPGESGHGRGSAGAATGDSSRAERSNGRRRVYCLIPADLAERLHEPLRRHFREDPSVEVVVEGRGSERRATPDRRAEATDFPAERERRRIRAASGRRIADRRAPIAAFDIAPELPRRARRFAERLIFFERVEPTSQEAEDADTARLVTRIQCGDAAAFADLYLRYFDRLYGYLRGALRNAHDAEDLTQQVFLSVFEQLPRYEVRGEPFRNWLFVVARNRLLSHLRKQGRIDPEDAESLERRRENGDSAEAQSTAAGSLGWITDSELLLFIERLPETQRQVLILRYMLDLDYRDIARVLDRTPTDVKTLHHRAVKFLRTRLAAVGRGPSRRRAGAARVFRPAEVLRHRRFALH